ncbi:MAG TPA: APC family permease [Pyrinomonadaceae bacterium]|nr:APC family permease [Pyrinomonadaceae bacterium]
MQNSVEVVPPADARQNRLLRVLGVVFGMAVTIGITIGMGILRTPGEVAAQLPNVWLFTGAWLVGGFYALAGAVSVAELSTMLPRSGGFYVFARHALGEYAGFVVGWSDWLSTCGTLAVVAIVIGEYTSVLVPSLEGRTVEVALAVVFAFAALQWGGVRRGSRTQELTSAVKTLAFAALIAACFIFGGEGSAQMNGAAGAALRVPSGLAFWTALVVALQGIIYTYDGWYSVVYFGEEVRDSGRSVPRAMIGSVLLVIGIYLLLNLALLYVVPLHELAGDKLAIGRAAQEIFGERGRIIISVLATVSMLAAINGNTLAAPRIIFAMSRDKLFWREAAGVNKGGTPTVALALSTFVAGLMIVFSGTFGKLLAALAFFFVVNYSVSFLSVFVLRRREPNRERPYRAWGYPWTTGLALVGSIAFLGGAVASDTRNSVYALLLLAASYPAFAVLRRLSR